MESLSYSTDDRMDRDISLLHWPIIFMSWPFQNVSKVVNTVLFVLLREKGPITDQMLHKNKKN